MPRVTGPLFSLEAYGKLKDAITYQRRVGGATVVFQPDPKQPRTVGQVAQRDLLTEASQWWQLVGELDKDAYRDDVAGRGMSGFNLFIQQYLLLGSMPLQVLWALVKDLSNESPAQSQVLALAYDAATGVALAGTYPDAQIWRSADHGATWTLVKDLSNESPAQGQVLALAYDAATGVALAGTYPDAQIWRSRYDY